MPNSHDNQVPFEPRPLPHEANQLCEILNAPPRLLAHLRLVHDSAVEIVAGLRDRFPNVTLDVDAVLFGVSTHDLGKVLFPQELTGAGHRHEVVGPQLLESHGVSPELARFARTHAGWRSERLPLEDLLVSLADSVWKGQRLDDLESQVIERIAEQIGVPKWEVFSQIDTLLGEVTERGEQRLAWQASH